MGDLSSGIWHVGFHENQHFPCASVSAGNSWPDLGFLYCSAVTETGSFSILAVAEGLLQVSGPAQSGSCGVLGVQAEAGAVPGLLTGSEPQHCEGPHCGFWNCPDHVPSLGLPDCLHLQIAWTYGLCYCASLGWFSPEPMFSHHHFSVIWETLFAMETNICWARDADSGPAGLCSYSWVCVRAVRDSWLIYLVLSLVLYCGAQSCVWLLTCQRGRRSEGNQGMASAPGGFVPCGVCASPTPSVCARWALAMCRDNVGFK